MSPTTTATTTTATTRTVRRSRRYSLAAALAVAISGLTALLGGGTHVPPLAAPAPAANFLQVENGDTGNTNVIPAGARTEQSVGGAAE